MRTFRVCSLLLALAGLVDLTACGSLFSTCHMCPPVPKSQHFVYTANSGGNQSTVSALSASPSTGALVPIAGSPFNAGAGSIALASSPAHGRLYVANSLSGDISAFTIDSSTGTLTQTVGSPFSTEIGVNAV